MNIRIITELLTDGSECYDVLLMQDDQTIRLHAVTADDADKLAHVLTQAIERHTVTDIVEG